MPILSTLLRCLLALALVTNGAGIRIALATEPAVATAMPACHGMSASDAGEELDRHAQAPTKHPDPADCCTGGQCDCACTHAPALPVFVASIPRLAPPSTPAPAPVPAPVAETRGSPFRPPIV